MDQNLQNPVIDINSDSAPYAQYVYDPVIPKPETNVIPYTPVIENQPTIPPKEEDKKKSFIYFFISKIYQHFGIGIILLFDRLFIRYGRFKFYPVILGIPVIFLIMSIIFVVRVLQNKIPKNKKMLRLYHFSMLGILLVNCIIDESYFRYSINLDFTMLSLSVIMSIIVGLLYIPTNKVLPLRVFLPLLLSAPLSYAYYIYVDDRGYLMIPVLTIVLLVYYIIFCFFWIYIRKNPNNNEMFYSATVSLTLLSVGLIAVVVFFVVVIILL